MRVAVSANGANLEAPASPVFGRCPVYVFVDTETMAFEAVENPAMSAGGGAGIQAAQLVVERGVQAVLTGNVGPNAFQVLQAAQVQVYPFTGGTVRQAVEALRQGRLQAATSATGTQHAGMGQGSAGGNRQEPTADRKVRSQEIAALQRTAVDLRRQLADVMERIDRLEKEG
ncbi:MAG: NifB/NifX family molybdenum-iron cluster-binding protein [Anaerolineae bacterium]